MKLAEMKRHLSSDQIGISQTSMGSSGSGEMGQSLSSLDVNVTRCL